MPNFRLYSEFLIWIAAGVALGALLDACIA